MTIALFVAPWLLVVISAFVFYQKGYDKGSVEGRQALQKSHDKALTQWQEISDKWEKAADSWKEAARSQEEAADAYKKSSELWQQAYEEATGAQR